MMIFARRFQAATTSGRRSRFSRFRGTIMTFSLFAKPGPTLEGNRIVLRHPAGSDYPAWAALRRESRAFLEPWEPLWAWDELERSAYRERLSRYGKERRDGSGYVYFIFLKDRMQLAGGITLGHLRRGVAQCGVIGYWMGERFAGKGYMGEAVSVIKHHAFGTLALHRLEAACIPDNERSVRLLKKAGFEFEGHLRSYLKINGRWRDHLLFSCIDTESDRTSAEVRED
jgi:[ribosomal protein S5]-alanine N-acetyltransferase